MSAAAATRLIELASLAATEALAASVAALARPGDAILLEGELGAGKTAFARALLRAASGDPALEVPSPTFTLAQSYDTRIGTVHHFDLWRLNGPSGLMELGWDEARDDIVVVEWPDRLGAVAAIRRADRGAASDRRQQPASGAVGLAGPAGTHRMNRERLIAAFLDRHGYGTARPEPLAQDASFRRYLRLSGGPAPAVLMDAPPPEDVRPFVRIAGHLRAIGVAAPEIFAADEAAGLLLEEDLGDEPVAQECLALSDLIAAADVLVAIQRAAPPPNLPVWDAATMAATALATLFDWWWPAMFGADAPAAARQDFAAALEAMLAPVAAGPACFVHRDFFAGNLHWLPQRNGVRRIAVLDFQNAAIGHPAYDLASLLQDARRDIPPGVGRTRHGPLPGHARGARRGGIPGRVRCLRGAATLADRRPMGAPRPPRRPTGLPDPRPAHLASAGAGGPRTGRRTTRRRARSLDTAGSTLQPTGPRGMTPRHAMLLAAGLSTRMRPLTDRTAKPLLPLGGRALIDHALDRLTEAGVETVVVNTHWRADQVEAPSRGAHPPAHHRAPRGLPAGHRRQREGGT